MTSDDIICVNVPVKGTNAPYEELSNYYVAPFTDANGLNWQTVEHYYQAHKFEHIPDYFHLIRFADCPKKAYYLGQLDPCDPIIGQELVHEGAKYSVNAEIMRHAHFRMREEWDLVKVSIMNDAIMYKFTQNPHLMWKLLATENRKIKIITPVDFYWGVGSDGDGLNWAGYLLEKLRYEMRRAHHQQATT